MHTFKKLRKRVCEANMELHRKGLVLYTFGNVSGIDRERGVVAIKPSGIPYDELTADKIVLVDLENQVIYSRYKPSSDTKTHLVLYREFPEIGGVVHTHSTFATAWAQAQKPIPCFGTTHADYVRGDIPCTRLVTNRQIRADYEEETGNQIAALFKTLSYRDVPMVLVAGHGPFTWGDSPASAVYNSVVLEELAKMAFQTVAINPTARRIKKSLIDKHFLRKHGKKAYYGQNEE